MKHYAHFLLQATTCRACAESLRLWELREPAQAAAAMQARHDADCTTRPVWEALLLLDSGRVEAAAALAHACIKGAATNAFAHHHEAMALHQLHRFEAALKACGAALRCNPRFAPAYVTAAACLRALGRHKVALLNMDAAVRLAPEWALAHADRAKTLAGLKLHEEAWQAFETAHALNPQEPFVLGDLLNAQLAVAAWDRVPERLQEFERRARAGELVANPWISLTLTDDAAAQRQCARSWASLMQVPERLQHFAGRRAKDDGPIRLGYLSPDLRAHVVGRFMAGVLAQHDHGRFHIVGMSISPAPADAQTEELRRHCDDFLELAACSDEDIVRTVADLDLDAVVDLCGYTENARPAVLRQRVAPVQIAYLGYAGTSGMAEIDYVIADREVLPERAAAHFVEQPIYLAPCFFPSDPKREVVKAAARRPGPVRFRSVAACEKLLPAMFDAWLDILSRVPGSELQLRGMEAPARLRLREHAGQRGIHPDRILFRAPVPLQEYLQDLADADLLLDAFPYGAHSAASDALWAGLPVLTLKGESFASRVASSLLRSLNLDELIVDTLEDYVEAATRLALDESALRDIRDRLREAASLQSAPFDNTSVTAQIEAGISAAVNRSRAGLAPAAIDACQGSSASTIS